MTCEDLASVIVEHLIEEGWLLPESVNYAIAIVEDVLDEHQWMGEVE